VRARRLCLAALALPLAAAAGCGGVSVSGASEATGNQLAIYSSLPLQGPSSAASEEIVNGERLALAQAGGRIGSFRVGFVSLDDVNPQTGRFDPGQTAANAKTAAQDTSTIAYLGELGSAATAVSLPLINAAGILQVSPGSPYVGLTSSLDAGQYEPERFYPTGRRTFGRLEPADPVQAAAQVALIGSLGVRSLYVLDDQNPFEVPLANLVADGARRAGIAVAGHDSLAVAGATTFAGEVEKVRASGAQAVFFAGGAGPATVALWRELAAADPALLLLGTSSLLGEGFTSAIGSAGARTYLTTPLLASGAYPPAASRALSAYRKQFGGSPGPYALYGYEAMNVVLAAIRSAGSRGNNRETVIERFFATRDRDSVLGRYSVQPNGETTLTRYGVDRVRSGRAVLYRALDVGRLNLRAG
jgi:branched-chain amino acid transport system substrate-binding protein